jgi:type III pantothenate kinase
MTESSILDADVGNSRTKFGLFAAGDPSAHNELPLCLQSWAVSHQGSIPWEEIRRVARAQNCGPFHGLVAGANPDGVKQVLATWPINANPVPRVIDVASALPLKVHLESPNKVGIDRLLNAVAANVVRSAGQPCVIVDTGTATTVDAVDPDGAFEGGSILPGFELSARALHQYTALLPYISIEELVEQSHEPLGTNTREALRSGLFWGQVGAIRELIAQLSGRWKRNPLVILTGGGAGLAAPQFPEARFEPHLSLQGLVIASHERSE